MVPNSCRNCFPEESNSRWGFLVVLRQPCSRAEAAAPPAPGHHCPGPAVENGASRCDQDSRRAFWLLRGNPCALSCFHCRSLFRTAVLSSQLSNPVASKRCAFVLALLPAKFEADSATKKSHCNNHQMDHDGDQLCLARYLMA